MKTHPAPGTAETRLRPAIAGDAGLLFEWLNQADSLAGKLLNSGPVSWPVHQAWFSKRLAAPDCGIWIAERGDGPVGQVRAERGADGRLHVDIFVIHAVRGEDVGAAMLEVLSALSAAKWPGEPLVARIRTDNENSRRFFEANGYRLAESKSDHLVFMRPAQT